MADDLNQLHENEREFGRARRLAAGLPDVDDRTQLNDDGGNGVPTGQMYQDLSRKNFGDGTKIDYGDKIEAVVSDYAQQFNAVSDLIRGALGQANLRTWQQLAKGTGMYAAGGDYFVVEWRIKPARRDPQQSSCGCGCGCGCGG